MADERTDFTKLAEETILSQYSTSPHIKGLVMAVKDAIDPTAEIEKFYDVIFNAVFSDTDAATCEYGLDVWGRIVAATRYIDSVAGEFFGHMDEGKSRLYSGYHPYDQRPFVYDEGNTPYWEMTPEDWRTAIKLKMYVNIADVTLPVLQSYVRTLFGNDEQWVKNGGKDSDDTTTMTVHFVLSNTTTAKMAMFKALTPFILPAGVDYTFQVITFPYFGFYTALPFSRGFGKRTATEIINYPFSQMESDEDS